MSEDIDALRRLVAIHARIEDPTNECSRLIGHLARAVDELEWVHGRVRDGMVIISLEQLGRLESAEQDAARLAGVLARWLRRFDEGTSAGRLFHIAEDSRAALAAHEARVKGGAP